MPALAALLLTACGKELPVQTGRPIYPDYTDVTVPVGIAPLNFCHLAGLILTFRPLTEKLLPPTVNAVFTGPASV